MPAEQRGSVYKTASKGFGIRWLDETGQRRRQPGFSSPSKARTWLRDVELVRMRGGLVDEPLTLSEFADRYVARYAADRSPVTVRTLRFRLVRPLDEFGDVKLTDLRAGEIAAWESTLPPRFRYAVVRALRQVLDAAVAWEYLARNPAKATGKNAKPTIIERAALEPSEVDRLAGELDSPHDVAVIVGAWCYLRPSELLALERADVDGNELRIRRTLDGSGGLKASGKTRRSLRTVPLPRRAQRRSPTFLRGSTLVSCSRLRRAVSTTPATGDGGSSSVRPMRRGSRASRPTHSDTQGSPGRSPPVCRRRTWRGSRERA